MLIAIKSSAKNVSRWATIGFICASALTCGHVGCCDSSKNKHATKHFHATKHPVVRSQEPGENWMWCYINELMFDMICVS